MYEREGERVEANGEKGLHHFKKVQLLEISTGDYNESSEYVLCNRFKSYS